MKAGRGQQRRAPCAWLGAHFTGSGGRPKRVLAMSDARRLCQDSDAKACLTMGWVMCGGGAAGGREAPLSHLVKFYDARVYKHNIKYLQLIFAASKNNVKEKVF